MKPYPGIYSQYDTKQEIAATPSITPLYIYRPPLVPHAYGRIAGPDGLYQRDVGPRKAPLRNTALPGNITRTAQRAYVLQSMSGNQSTQYANAKAPRIPTTLQARNVRQRG